MSNSQWHNDQALGEAAMRAWKDWHRRAEELGGGVAASPAWTTSRVPMCSEDECGLYDGKRCRALGQRPSRICEPVVERMAELLERHK